MEDFPTLEFGKEAPKEASGKTEQSLPVLDMLDTGNLSEVESKKSALSIENLDEDEQKLVRDFVKKIELTDTTAVLNYGIGAQSKISRFSDSILKDVRTKDAGEAGELLNNMIVEIKSLDVNEDEQNFVQKFFGKAKKNYESMSVRYNTVEKNINNIAKALEKHRHILLKDIAMYENMYENNHKFFKEVTYYIIAGKEKIKEMHSDVLPEYKRVAQESGDQMDAVKFNDMVQLTNNFEKKIADLQVSRMVSIHTAPQIRMLQNSNSQLVDKIQTSIVNTIPLWKNQIIIALGQANTQKALKAQQEVSKMTNELLIKNSEMLKLSSTQIARESEKTIISIEAIRESNKNLIDTIEEVIQIQEEGRVQRANLEQELVTMEVELKQGLFKSQVERQNIEQNLGDY